MTEADYKYWAFISYSHQDKVWGDWLHKTLENYRVPGRLAGRASRDGQVPKRLYPIFRDREELPSSADLGNNISDALRRSRYLLVICSPHAAPSRWVNEEIKTFKKLGREDRILALIVDGEPNASDKPDSGMAECFPAALSHKLRTDGELSGERVEPIAADARPGKDGRANAALKLIAGLLGVGYDELKQRERQRCIRRRIQWCTAVLLLLALAAGVWRWEMRQQELQRYVERGREALLHGDAGVAALYLNEAYAQGVHTPALRLMLAHALLMALPEPKLLTTPGRTGIAAISTDGSRIITAVPWNLSRMASALQLWDWERGKTLVEQPYEKGVFSGAAFAPDGKRFAVATTEGRVTVYGSTDGKAQLSIRDTPSHFLQAMFSPDGKAILTVSDQPQARLWDAVSGKLLETLDSDAADPRDTRFSTDGRRLITCTRDGRATVWDLVARRRALAIKPPHSACRRAWFARGERFIVTVDKDAGGELWDAVSGKLVKTADGGDNRDRNLVVDRGGNRLLSMDADHHAVMHDLQVPDLGPDLFMPLPLSSGDAQYENDLSEDGYRAATGTLDGGITLWNAPGGNVIATLPLPHGAKQFVYQLRLLPDGRHLAGMGFTDRTQTTSDFLIWELPTAPYFMGTGMDGDMSHVAAAQGDYVSALGADGSAELWGRRDARLLAHFDAGLDWTDWIFNDASEVVAAHKVSGVVTVWDIRSGRALASLHPYSKLSTVAFSPESRRLFLSDGRAGCELRLDAPAHCTPLPSQGSVVEARYSADGGTLAVWGDHVLAWDTAASKLRTMVPPPAHSGELAALDVSRDGQRLVALYADGFAERVNLLDGSVTGSTSLPVESRFATAVQADRQLAAVMVGGNVQIWDLTQNRLKASLDNPATRSIGWMAFNPEGTLLVASDKDDHAGIYDVDSGRQLLALEGSGNGGPPFFSRDGASVMQTLMGTLAIWDLTLESRSPEEIAALLRCRVAWRLEGNKPVAAAMPDAKTCPAHSGMVSSP